MIVWFSLILIRNLYKCLSLCHCLCRERVGFSSLLSLVHDSDKKIYVPGSEREDIIRRMLRKSVSSIYLACSVAL